MTPIIVDRDTFLQNLRVSKLLTNQQFRLVVEKLTQVQDAREMAKALASWKLLTKFQAKMLMRGRNSGFYLGPYKILDQLGQGGMGRVYKANHQTMNRVVALKVLSPQVVSSERARELFLREVQAAAQLSHPNIVMAYDANQIDNRHFLAMEYVDGPNLEVYVKRNGPLPVGIACEIAFQTANGLQHAHEKGMVHRDIKPANLLLQQDPGSAAFHVKILDFGLARLHQPDSAGDTIVVRENTVMGTPDFLSPEQSRSLHDVDIRADLYSLGCTLYYLLTGKIPFPGGSMIDKVFRHNNEIAAPIEELRPDVPEKIAGEDRRHGTQADGEEAGQPLPDAGRIDGRARSLRRPDRDGMADRRAPRDRPEQRRPRHPSGAAGRHGAAGARLDAHQRRGVDPGMGRRAKQAKALHAAGEYVGGGARGRDAGTGGGGGVGVVHVAVTRQALRWTWNSISPVGFTHTSMCAGFRGMGMPRRNGFQ
jgi:tRNA A-37 threonylcarbamoyl transferase component Bud32